MDFEEIYYLYFRDVFLYIRSLSGDEGIAEEVAQETKCILDMIHLMTYLIRESLYREILWMKKMPLSSISFFTLWKNRIKKSYSIAATHPITLEIDGKEKNVIFLYYTETFAESHSKKLINREEIRDERDFIFPLDKKENVDAIYYADFDVRKIFEEGNNWDTVLEDAILIWGK